MRLGHIELFVRDAAASRDFYVLHFGAEPVADQGQSQWIKFGDLELLLRPGAPPASLIYGSNGTGLVFYCSDLQAELRRLQESGLEQQGFDGQDCCPLFRDPDGYWIQIVDPDYQAG